jgi:hypothetical protein
MRETAERFHAHVPGRILERFIEPVSCEAGVLLEPPVSFDDFKGIGGCHKNLREERVRVKSYRGQELVQLFLRISVLLLRSCALVLRRWLGTQPGRQSEEKCQQPYQNLCCRVASSFSHLFHRRSSSYCKIWYTSSLLSIPWKSGRAVYADEMRKAIGQSLQFLCIVLKALRGV